MLSEDFMLTVDKVIVYGRTFDPIGGVVRQIEDVWMRIESEDATHVVRIADITHMKFPKEVATDDGY